MFSYTVCGLGIRSALPLPELVAGERGSDVVLRQGCVGYRCDDSGSIRCLKATADEILLSLGGVGAALIRNGCDITVEPAPGVEERVLRLFILGPTLGVLLHQRGLLVLHASVVELEGGAVAFLGWKGSGKSTTAAALCERGHALVSDDVLVVAVDGAPEPVALPGVPQLKLWPDALLSLGNDPTMLPLLHPAFEKRACQPTQRIWQAPLPLRHIYVLDVGSALQITPVCGQTAFAELVRHSYASRFLGPAGAGAVHFHQCATLARRIPVSRLCKQDSLAMLADLARLIEQDLA